ncbi:MAG: DUF1499 domain-containing protein [Thiohalophilus sp.]
MHKHVYIVGLAGLLVALVSVILAAMAVSGYREGDLHFATAIQDFELAAYFAVAALVLSLIGAWLTRPATRQRGFVPAVLGVILALPLVAFIVNFEYAARAYPPINDITTDTDNPPDFWDVSNPAVYPGEKAARLQREGYPDLQPLYVALDSDEAFALAAEAARAMGWEIVAENEMDKQIEAVDTTFLFGFKDNIVIRVEEEQDQSRIDVRSQSRLGRIDRGVNAKRIQHYLNSLEQQAQQKKSG